MLFEKFPTSPLTKYVVRFIIPINLSEREVIG